MNPKGKACAIVSGQNIENAICQVQKAHALGAGLVELRMDLIECNGNTSAGLIKKAHSLGLACIATWRDKEEGGKFEGKDKTELVRSAINAGADYVDLELRNRKIIEAIKNDAAKTGCKIIASWHDFGKQPALAAMTQKIKEAKKAGAGIAKIAFVSNKGGYEKAIDGLAFTAEQNGIALVASPMGKDALNGRAYALSKGSAFAYCTLDGKESIAPGVPTIGQLKAVIEQNG
ncbi:MAG: type I 3-dehydroquinate dehydratase [Candidatus Micrarchaeia archaeon]|jgi:3-dehydroquinate dehydratase type I